MKTLITQPTELQLNPRPYYTELISINDPVFSIKAGPWSRDRISKGRKLAANAKQIFTIDLTRLEHLQLHSWPNTRNPTFGDLPFQSSL